MTVAGAIADYRALLIGRQPLLDLRAPLEFAKGAFPQAVNLPLLDDEQRQQVGVVYHERGQAAALALGHNLLSGRVKEQRMSGWIDFVRRHPVGGLYCFRGGQRSAIVQQWLADVGLHYPRVVGGYKALRRFLIDQLERLPRALNPTLLGGRTGVGKTDLLLSIPQSLDLEALANHRGSGFGRQLTPQPTQIDFENALAIEMLCRQADGVQSLVLEDESRCIGVCALPEALWASFDAAPIAVLEDRLETRVTRIRQQYVEAIHSQLLRLYPEDGYARFEDFLQTSLQRIARRLGGVRYRELHDSMSRALVAQNGGAGYAAHDEWIERLLVEYYDPMYDYQIARKAQRVVFRGFAEQVSNYLNALTKVG